MDPIRSLFRGSGALEWGAVCVAIGLVVLLRTVLPPEGRRRLRAPLLLLGLYGVLSLGAWLFFDADADGAPAAPIAVFFLILGLVNLTFTLVFATFTFARGRVPKIVQDVLTAIAYFVVLMAFFRARGVELSSILTTSALLTAVVGFALQDTLGNVIAGLAIQVQRSYSVGDWIALMDQPDRVGMVTEINWRVTKIRTIDNTEVLVPNGTIAKSAVVNYSKPSRLVRRSLRVSIAYDVPPGRVEEVALRAVAGSPGVLAEPKPDVVLESFADSGIQYWIRYHIDDFALRDVIAGRIAARLYYELLREGISIPYPIRTVYLHERSDEQEKRAEEERTRKLAERFRAIDFLAPLGDEDLRALAARVKTVAYGRGEHVVHQGDVGTDFFLIEHGEVSVVVDVAGAEHEVARLKAGDFFGEMSLMTGETRRATVVAQGDVVAVRVDKESFRAVLADNPELVEQISRVLAVRQTALEEQAAATPSDAEKAIRRRSLALLGVIRGFFRL